MNKTITVAVTANLPGSGCSAVSQAITEFLLAGGFTVSLVADENLARDIPSQAQALSSITEQVEIVVTDKPELSNVRYMYKNMKINTYCVPFRTCLAKARSILENMTPEEMPKILTKG